MGSAASGQTRAYTVENQGSVIDISDNVVKRLKNQLGELGTDFVTTHLFVVASHFHNKVNFVMQPVNVDAQQTHERVQHLPLSLQTNDHLSAAQEMLPEERRLALARFPR